MVRTGMLAQASWDIQGAALADRWCTFWYSLSQPMEHAWNDAAAQTAHGRGAVRPRLDMGSLSHQRGAGRPVTKSGTGKRGC